VQELIDRITNKVGLSEDKARKAVGIIIDFLRQDAPDEKVNPVLDAMPGSRELADQAGSGGIAAAMGPMGAFSRLTSVGLGMNEVQQTASETVDYAREKAGAEKVNELVRSIPGLGQFV
jgi:hypothetical protein